MNFSSIQAKVTLILTLCLAISAFSHGADPNSALAKYVMYGDEGVHFTASAQTASSGWIGTSAGYNITGSATYNTAIHTEGNLNMSGGAVKVESNVEGNLSYSKWQATLNAIVHYGGTLGGTPNPAWQVNDGANTVDPVEILPSDPTINFNTNNCSYNGSSWSCSGSSAGISGDTLLPGSYGAIQVLGPGAIFKAGLYEIKSFLTTQNYGQAKIEIAKSSSEVTRILSQDGFTLEQGTEIRTTGLLTDLGKVLLYSNTNFGLNNNVVIDATIYVPYGTLSVVSGSAINGQALAKLINIDDGFNGFGNAFVGFDPSGVSLVGASSFVLREDSTEAGSDSDPSTRNSGTITVPVELGAPSNGVSTLSYTVRGLTQAWTAEMISGATIGADTLTSDITMGSLGASSISGTLTFADGATTPSTPLKLFIVDDYLAELDVGDKEWFEIVFTQPSDNIKFEADPAAQVTNADTLLYAIALVSDDAANEAPTDISISKDSINEGTLGNIILSGVDPDADMLTFQIVGGVDQSYFEIDSSNTSSVVLKLKSAAVFENAAGVIQDTILTVTLQTTDPSGETYQEIFSIRIVNVDDHSPVFTNSFDTIQVLETLVIGSDILDLEAFDADVGSNITYSILSGAKGQFSVNSATGLITSSTALNFEDVNFYTIIVKATSGTKSVDDTVYVQVLNVNESPEFTGSTIFTIDENTLAGEVVNGSLTASDIDGNSLVWSISTNSLFDIDSITGQITLMNDSTLNYEVQDTIELTLQVTDGGITIDQVIQIIVKDVNDAPRTLVATYEIDENQSGVIGNVIAGDEDGLSTLRYEIESSNIYKIDSLTGIISFRNGKSLDYESVKSDTIIAYVTDGEYSDTTMVVVNVNNLAENSPIEIVEVFDDNKTWDLNKDVLTNNDSINVVFNKNGILDTIRFSLKDGVNLLKETYTDPESDKSGTAKLTVTKSDMAPVFTVIGKNAPQDTNGVFWINDLETDSIEIQVRYVDQDLKVKTKTVLVPIEEIAVEGKVKKYNYSYTDEFGNTSEVDIKFILDTIGPKVTIVSPIEKSTHDSIQVIVDYTVEDGTILDNYSDTVIATSEFFMIIKQAEDFAGNVTADTVMIRVQMKDAESEVEVVKGLVKELSEEEILTYFEEKDRESDPAFNNVILDKDGDGIPDDEVANISIVNKSNLTISELLVKTKDKSVKRTVFSETPITGFDKNSLQVNSTGIALAIDVSFPMNGGYTVDGLSERRGGFIPDSLLAECGGDSTMFKLSIDPIRLFVFDHIGQYVTQIKMPGVDVSNPEWQGDDGRVTLLLDIPQLKEGLRDAQGVKLGSGAYIINGAIKSRATPRACVNHIATESRSSNTLLQKVGYKRKQ